MDEIAQVFQFDGEIDVVHHDVFGDGQDDRGKIQNADDAALDEAISHLLSHGRRNGQDRHFDMVLRNKLGQ